jgi:hypothetical protein
MASLRQRKGVKSMFIKIACSTRPLTISGLEQPSIFAEEQGDKGPQASSVRIAGKRGRQDEQVQAGI